MKLSKFDIGAEIISILTRGMYPDPRDAVREYIQNSIDAGAENVEIKVRQDSIVIQDDGSGMDYDALRRSVRIGISDKNPSKDIGFMGIGIYSAFHLCDKLEIHTRVNEGTPNVLNMDFGKMKSILSKQKLQRIQNEIESDELMGLQTLLENYIDISEESSVDIESFPSKGTRIEISGLSNVFLPYVTHFDPLAEYLREVIPLHFDPLFSHGAKIEQKISEICKEHDADFELISLKLQVDGRNETLFRPYKDNDFNAKEKPQEPTILPILAQDNEFLGVVWGCLNSVRKIVDTKHLRGFVLKKQGFSIGKRENLVKYFPRGNTFFPRYIGEVIVTHPQLLPNASRSDLEFSNLRSSFFEALTRVADQLDEKGDEFQEWTKADDELGKITAQLKLLNAAFYKSGTTTEKLVDILVQVINECDKIEKRIKRNAIRPGTEGNAEEIMAQARQLESLIQEKINSIVTSKRTKNSKEESLKIAETLTDLPVVEPKEKKYESLVELLDDFDLPIADESLKSVLSFIDDKFIAGESNNKKDYYDKLEEVRSEILKFEELG